MKEAVIDTERFAVALREFRGSKTLASVNAETGVDMALLSRIENGKMRPGLDTYSRLCAWMGVSMEEFRVPFSEAA